MRSLLKARFSKWSACAALLFAGLACLATTKPGQQVQSGDEVYLNYSCKDDAGELVITTAADTAVSTAKKAAIFAPLHEPGPVMVIAGNEQILRIDKLRGPADFDQAAAAYLAEAVVGQPYDRSLYISIHGELQKSITESERFLKLNRRQWRTRNHWVNRQELVNLYKREPRIGDVYPSAKYPDKIYYRIDAIKDDQVQTRVTFEDNTIIDDPFGRLRFVNVDEERFQVITETLVGHLVRSGSLVGRVAAVDDSSYTMDYGNPLAGLTLECETTVAPAKR